MAKNQPPPVPIDDDTLIARNTSLLSGEVHNEMVMMSIESGRYYGLDDIGTDIWRRLETPRKFGEIIDALGADYDADREMIEKDVRVLIAKMAAHDVVKLAPAVRDRTRPSWAVSACRR